MRGLTLHSIVWTDAWLLHMLKLPIYWDGLSMYVYSGCQGHEEICITCYRCPKPINSHSKSLLWISVTMEVYLSEVLWKTYVKSLYKDWRPFTKSMCPVAYSVQYPWWSPFSNHIHFIYERITPYFNMSTVFRHQCPLFFLLQTNNIATALSFFITRDVITHCYSSRNKSVPYL